MVMQSIEQLQAQQKQLLERLTLAEKQLADEKVANRQQYAVYAAQQEQIAQLKDKIRRLQNTTAQLNESRKLTKQNLDKKIEKIAQAIKPADPVEVPGSSVEEEKDHYTAAYLALKSGRYEEAINNFRDLLKAHPNSAYSDQAYYWLGESYVAQGRNKDAVEAFTMVANNFPQSPKHAAALLKLASVYESLNMIGDARAVLNRVTKEHPDSRSAERARVQLSNLAPADAGTKP